MEYKDFSVEDFAADDHFIKWVRNPDIETDLFWRAFLKENPDRKEEIEKAREMVSILSFKKEELTEEAISSMRKHIIGALQAERTIKKNDVQKRISWIRWAASLSLLSLLVIGYFLLLKSSPSIATAVLHNSNRVETENRINPKGQKSILFLSDGTKVWLNADSQLNYQSFDKRDVREVYLEGEAYFDVVQNLAKPFIVRTSGISIKVLGTAFNVKSYREDKVIETTLVHGKVSLNKTGSNKENESLILKPNQRAVFSKESSTVNIQQVDATRAASWRFDKLIFDETPLYDAIAQLERWYDVDIHVEPAGDFACGLTAEIGNEKLEDVLKLLEITHKVNYSIAGREVFIKGVLCK